MFNTQKKLLVTAVTALIFITPVAGMSQENLVRIGKGTCQDCADTPTVNMLKGTLESFSLKNSSMQLSTSTGTKVITVNDDTILTGVDRYSSLKSGSNLKIEYLDDDEGSLAIGILVTDEPVNSIANNQIDAKALVDLLKDKLVEITLIDVRSASSFEQEHIPGAISIPNRLFDKNLDKLPKNKNQLIVYYCDGTS